MAETDVKLEGVSFEKDPTEYCKIAYAEALERVESLRDLNKENRLFYEGVDEQLNMRSEEENVDRSNLFVHQLKPAIDTRKSSIFSAIEDREFPVQFRPASVVPTDEEKQQVAWIQKQINEQMRSSGYLMDVYNEQITGAEIYRSPSAVKIGWENVTEKKPVIKRPTAKQLISALINGQGIPKNRVVWEEMDKAGRVTVQWLPPDENLYEPNISDFNRDSEYWCHPIWVQPYKLDMMAEELGWDKAKTSEFKNSFLANDSVDNKTDAREAFQDDVDSERQVENKKKKRENKVLVQEFYIVTFNDLGEEIIRQVYMLGNKTIVKNSKTPMSGIKFPVVLAVADKLPGTIEGLSAVDIGKMTQRLYNELFNMYIDGVSYKTFPPLLKDPSTNFTKQPKWGLGQIWELTNQEGLRPLVENPGQLPNLPALMTGVAGLLRSNLNAEDIQQGFNSNPNEKATSTQLRTMGASRRSFTMRQNYGQVVIEVAKQFLALNQQFADDKENYVIDVLIDVPSLTSTTDPDQEKQDALLMLNQSLQLPSYQTPLGQTKIRNLTQNVIEKFFKHDWQRFLQTDEEFKEELQIQTEQQIAMVDKQNSQEQIAIDNQTAETVSQGGQSGV